MKNKKQLKNSIERKNYLISSIVSASICCLFIIAFIAMLDMYNDRKLTESDLEYKEYTVDLIEVYTGREYYIDIYVEEEKTNLIVDSVIADISDFRNKITELKQGDRISCYVKKGSNEIVEIKHNEMIFSFDDYKEQSKKAGLTGLLIIPVFVIWFGFNAVRSYIEHKKLKRTTWGLGDIQ